VNARVRAAVKELLPDLAVRRIQQGLAGRAFRRSATDGSAIDLDKVSLIRDASLSDLGNARIWSTYCSRPQ
jgi:hypothetical protein